MRTLKAAIQVHELEPAAYAAWDAMVEHSPHGSAYASSRYLEVLCRATGGHFRILAAMHGADIVGAIAVYGELSRVGTVVQSRLLLRYKGFALRADHDGHPS